MAQRACLWTVLRCKEQDFQRFLGVDCETAAARRVKELCEICSRAELDRNIEARQRFDQRIRLPYIEFQERELHAKNQAVEASV